MHDSAIGRDGPPQYMVGVGKVDNNNLILFVDLFTDTNEVVGLERQSLETMFQRQNLIYPTLQRLT